MSLSAKLTTIVNNTPAVCEKVNSEKITVTGGRVRAENVLDVSHELDVALTSDTLTDFSGVTVTALGKNLINCDSLNAESDMSKVIFQGELTGSFRFSCLFNYESCKTPTAAQFSFIVDGTTKYMARGTSEYNSLAISGTLTKITFLNWGYGVGTINEIQLEEGSTRTDYVPYSAQTVNANQNGTVDGLNSVSPITTVITDTSDVSVECSYLPQAAQPTIDKYLVIKQKMQELSEQLDPTSV